MYSSVKYQTPSSLYTERPTDLSEVKHHAIANQSQQASALSFVCHPLNFPRLPFSVLDDYPEPAISKEKRKYYRKKGVPISIKSAQPIADNYTPTFGSNKTDDIQVENDTTDQSEPIYKTIRYGH